MPTVSVIVPCYNEEESLPLFFNEFTRATSSMRENGVGIELIFVDDGSSDSTLLTIKTLQPADTLEIRWMSFSRNFGKEAALFAGLEMAKGSYIAFMDADLQDPPSLLPSMYEALLAEGVDCVAARRVSREGEPRIRSVFARLFYKLLNRISHTEIADGARDYRVITRRMANAVLSVREYNRFSKGIFSWVGFTTKWVPYVNQQRVAGETKWNALSLLLYSIDGIVAFSSAPLAAASVVGLALCLVAIVGVLFIFMRALLFGDPVSGWPSLACIITLLGGIQLLCLGVIGQYLAKTYLETKQRPLYIKKESSDDQAIE